MLIKFSDSKVAKLIEGLGCLLGFIGLMIVVRLKIDDGDGVEQYIAMSGVKLSYIQAWYIILSIPCLVFIMFFLVWFLRRDERDFKKKYEKRHNK